MNESSDTQKRLRHLLGIAWRLALCLVLLAWIFHSIFMREGQQRYGAAAWDQMDRAAQWHAAWTAGPQELWHTLRLVQPFYLAASLVMVWATIFLGVARWRMVLRTQGLSLPFLRAMNISFVAQFFNSFLLGSTGGDLIKAYYAARETHHLKTEAVVTVFVDRLIGLWSMLFFGGLMILPNLYLITRPHHRLLAVMSALLLGMLAALTVLLYIAFWGGVSKRFPRARIWLRRFPKGALLERSLDSCRQFGKFKMFLLNTVLISLVINVVAVFQVIFLAIGLDLKIPWTSLFLIVPGVICISSLPITPAGLGVRENLFVRLLAVPLIAVPATLALSLSLLTYAGGLFWSLIGGVIYMGIKKTQHLEEVTKAEVAPPENGTEEK